MFLCPQDRGERPTPKSTSALFLCESYNQPTLQHLALSHWAKLWLRGKLPLPVDVKRNVADKGSVDLGLSLSNMGIAPHMGFIGQAGLLLKNLRVYIFHTTISQQQLILLKCK